MEFIELSLFAALLSTIFTDAEYQELQNALVGNPESGDLIPGGRGLRKIRWYSRAKRQGKRGGVRVIYYYAHDDRIFMFFLYNKSRQDDLKKHQLKALMSLMEDIDL